MTSELTKRSLSAAKWGVSSTLLRFLLQIVAQAILARLLGPEAYGVFGVGIIVMALTSLLTDIGFSWNLLRKVDLSETDIQFALTGQILFGTVLSILLYIGADFVAFQVTGEPAGWVIRLLAFSVIFNAAASTPSILLSRALNFRDLGKSQLLSYVAGYFFVGIPMALAGCGALALVAAWLVQSVVRCALAFNLCRLVWVPTIRHEDYRLFLSSGLLVFVTNMVNWLAYNLDRVAVSRLMSVQFLGIYNVSANLAATPNAILLGSVQPVFLATGAQLQDTASLREAYGGVLRAALLTAPVFYGCLALGAEDLVHLLYGEKWSDASKVLRILFLGMPFVVIWSLSTPVLWNTLKPHYEAGLQVPIVIFSGIAYFSVSDMGLVALALTADLVLFLRALVLFIAASRQLSLDWRTLVPAACTGLVFALVALGSRILVSEIPMSGWMRLFGAALLTMALCLTLLKWLPYRLSVHAIEVVRHVSNRTASWLQGHRPAAA